jgi:hypothetical protein
MPAALRLPAFSTATERSGGLAFAVHRAAFASVYARFALSTLTLVFTAHGLYPALYLLKV